MMPKIELPLPDKAADDIFLSPRVIDAGALDELEGRLQAIIQHALETGQALVSLDEESRASLKALQQAGPALDKHSREAAKLLQTLDQRVSDAEQLLGRAIERADRAERFEGDIDAIVASAEQRVQLRIDAMVADGEQRIRAAAEMVSRQVEEIVDEAQRAVSSHAADARRDAESDWARLSESSAQATAAAAELEDRLGSLRREASAIGESLESHCTRAELVLGEGGDGMAGVVARAEQLCGDASETIRRLEGVQAQTEQARGLLARALAQAGTQLDELSDKQSGLHRDIKESARLCDAAVASLDERVTELRACLREPMAAAEGESRRLSELITRVEAAARVASDATARHEVTMSRMDEGVRALEPWRAVMLENRAELPAALQSVVEEFRVEIGRRVGQIADGLKAIATTEQKETLPPEGRQREHASGASA